MDQAGEAPAAGLLRIFFAATIGFEVPVREFAVRAQFWRTWRNSGAISDCRLPHLRQPIVIGRAAVLSVAAVGKIATGFWVRPLRKSEFFKVGFAMTAWGEFAFITAATAKEAGIIDAELFSSAILAVMLSVVVSLVLLRLVIVRNQKAAVASIASAKEHARGGGTGDVPVYYRLQTRSAPSWGLNARLMDIVTTNSLQTLDFRSQHSADRVANELYLKARRCPPRRRHAAARRRRRFSSGSPRCSPKSRASSPTEGRPLDDGSRPMEATRRRPRRRRRRRLAPPPRSQHPDEHARRRRRRWRWRRRRRRRRRSRLERGGGAAAARGARVRWTTRTTRSLRRRRGISTPPRARLQVAETARPRRLRDGGAGAAGEQFHRPPRWRRPPVHPVAAAPRQQWIGTDGRRHRRMRLMGRSRDAVTEVGRRAAGL